MSETPNSRAPKKSFTVETSLIRRTGTAGTRLKLLQSALFNSYPHSNVQRPRHVPNKYEKRNELSSDDPPSVRPFGYKSPFLMTKEGDQIEVWWEGNDEFYSGTVRSLQSDGKHRVDYVDGDVRYHFLDREVYALAGKALERILTECFPQDARRHLNSDQPVHYPRLSEFLEVGHQVRIYWLEKNQWFRGAVTAKDEKGKFFVTYSQGDTVLLRMQDETFRFIEESAAVVHTRLVEDFLGDKLSSQGISDEDDFEMF